MKKRQKSEGKDKLTDELDKVFSRYIRLSYANKDGYAQCVTCNRIHHWKDLHCGHFISRRHKATRWDERNVAPQCPACNIYNQGAGPAFASYLIKKFGANIVDMLLLKSKQVCRMSRFEYETLINDYNEKLKQYDGALNKGRKGKDPVRKGAD